MAQSSTVADIKSLASKSVIYGLGSVLLRSINFFLLPLYTRYLTPTDYGIIAVTLTLTAILTILYPLSLHGAVTRFYFSTQSDRERRQYSGTIWIGMVLAAAGMAILLDYSGSTLFPLLFREVPFAPYIRLAIWTAFFSVLGLMPLTLWQTQERAGAYVLMSIVGTLLSISFIIFFVVFQQQGAYGYLLGMLWASGLMAGPYLLITLRQVQITIQWRILAAALMFSLPLVPHSLASWVLELSDRIILERFVSLNALGLYALAYQLGTIINITATAINNAWVPYLFRTEAERGDAAKPNLARLATYYTLILSWAALSLSLLARDILLLLTAPAFHTAYRVMPWIIWGLFLSGLYYIPVNFLFLKSKTGWVPVVTVLSGLVNIGLNVWLVPHYGILAAAWATFFSYGVMLILVWGIALRVYPFPYEYKRLGIIGLGVVSLSALGLVTQFDSTLIDLGVKSTLLLVYPLALALLGFFTPTEKARALMFTHQTWLALRTRGARWI